MTELTAKSYDPTTLGVQEEDPHVLKDEDGNVLPSFDLKHEEDFKGLLYIGALQDEFEWLGHRISIRTLKDGELLAVGQIIKPYQDTVGAERAYVNAVVALCLVSIDGQELPTPIGETGRINEWAHQRFNYVRDNYFSSTVDVIYNKYLVLNDKVAAVIDAMSKASAPDSSSTPTSSDI